MKNEYNDQDVFEKEFQLFYNEWIWSERVVSEIKEGIYTLVVLPYGQEIILTQSEGAIKAFLNVCPHRKSALLFKDSEKISCPFHGWEFNEKGQCTATPGITNIKIDKIHLQDIKVEIYADFIYVSFQKNPPTFKDWIERYITNLPYRKLHFAGVIELEINSNWKLSMENECDSLHVGTSHPELSKTLSFLETDLNSETKISEIKGWIAESSNLKDGVKAVTSDHKRVDGENSPSIWMEYKVFPHMAPAYMSDYTMINLYHPISTNKTKGFIYFYVYDESHIEKAKTAIELWQRTLLEDKAIMESNHRGNQSVFYTKGKILPKSDVAIIGAFEKEYAIKMKQINEGV